LRRGSSNLRMNPYGYREKYLKRPRPTKEKKRKSGVKKKQHLKTFLGCGNQPDDRYRKNSDVRCWYCDLGWWLNAACLPIEEGMSGVCARSRTRLMAWFEASLADFREECCCSR